MNARTAATLGLLSASVLGAALGHCRGLRSGMAIGYAYGDRDGVRRERRRLESQAMLDAVLDAPIAGRASHASDAANTHPPWCRRPEGHAGDLHPVPIRYGGLRDRAAGEVTP